MKGTRKRWMKRILVLCVVGMMAFAMGACSTGKSSGGSKVSTESVQEGGRGTSGSKKKQETKKKETQKETQKKETQTQKNGKTKETQKNRTKKETKKNGTKKETQKNSTSRGTGAGTTKKRN